MVRWLTSLDNLVRILLTMSHVQTSTRGVSTLFFTAGSSSSQLPPWNRIVDLPFIVNLIFQVDAMQLDPSPSAPTSWRPATFQVKIIWCTHSKSRMVLYSEAWITELWPVGRFTKVGFYLPPCAAKSTHCMMNKVKMSPPVIKCGRSWKIRGKFSAGCTLTDRRCGDLLRSI